MQPLLAAIGALAAQLPLLPPLLPGQVLSLLDPDLPGRSATTNPESNDSSSSVTSSSSDDATAGSGGDAWGVPGLSRGDWRTWCAALQCMRRLKQEQAAGLTQAGAGPADSHAVLKGQMRCLLVLGGLLSWRELTPCRALVINSPHALLSDPAAGQAGGDPAGLTGGLAALLPLLAAATRCAPQAAQAQLLQEALQAAQLCARPANALALAAAMVGAWVQPHGGGAPAARSAVAAVDAALLSCGSSCSSSGSSSGSGSGGSSGASNALLALAHSLPALLAAPAWSPSADGIATGLLAAARLPGVPAPARLAVRSGVVAVRQRVAAASWEVIAADIAAA